MRLVSHWFTALLIIGLTAGPALALPVASPYAGPTMTADLAPASPFVRAAEWLALSVGVVGITIRKDVGSIAAKYVTRASAASGDYKDGVSAAGQKWEQNAGNAEASWEQGVQQAIGTKRFAHGVQGKGSKFQTNAVNLGSQRYGPGVTNAKDAYARGMAPVVATLSGLTLPPKSFRGSPANQARANAVATALAAMRVGH